jgi:predicted ester cyclase
MATKESIEQNYLAYISAINAKDWLVVSSFCQPSVVHNKKAYSNEEYAYMIGTTSSPFKGIKFVPETVVIDENKGEIACRIRFEWAGEPFYEHVFYKLEDGKISTVSSIVNLPR